MVGDTCTAESVCSLSSSQSSYFEDQMDSTGFLVIEEAQIGTVPDGRNVRVLSHCSRLGEEANLTVCYGAPL